MKDVKLPVLLLTGFLGSGKTTLVNHILQGEHGLRVAVIVNEFGDIGIDHHLITRLDETLIELTNGCICCSIRDDLFQAIAALIQGNKDLDILLIETTGVADPVPIAQSFFQTKLENTCRLDGIITLVDGENLTKNLTQSTVVAQQIGCADFILINKCDLISRPKRQFLSEKLRELNPEGRQFFCRYAKIPYEIILGVRQPSTKKFLNSGFSDHRIAIQSASFTFPQPFILTRLQQFLQRIPENIYRGKGVLYLDGIRDRGLFNLVGSRASIEWCGKWNLGTAQSELVFLGGQLDIPQLREELKSCLKTNGRVSI